MHGVTESPLGSRPMSFPSEETKAAPARLYSLSAPPERACAAADQMGKKGIAKISTECKQLQQSLLYKNMVSKKPEDLKKDLLEKQGQIQKLKKELDEAKASFKEGKKAISSGEYRQYSKDISKLETELSVLEASCKEYESLSSDESQTALQLAKGTYEDCQVLMHFAKYDTKCNAKEYGATLKELQRKKEELKKLLLTLENAPIAKKTCQEAISFIQQALQIAQERIEKKMPFFFSREKRKAFQEAKAQTLFAIGKLKEPADLPEQTPLRMSFGGRRTHATQVSGMKASLDVLEHDSAALFDMVSSGKLHENIEESVSSLQNRIAMAKTAYENMQTTYGKKASSEQFVERAIAQTLLASLEKRVESLKSLLPVMKATVDTSNNILDSLKKAVYEKKEEVRAQNLFQACKAWQNLHSLIDEAAISDPFAQSFLQEKLTQLEEQISVAFPSFDPASAPYVAAKKLAYKTACTPKEQSDARGFLVGAMAKIVMTQTEEAASLRTIVDLCLLQMSEEDKDQLPEDLLHMYQATQEPQWTSQIGQVNELLMGYKELLSKKNLSDADLNTLVDFEEKVRQLQKTAHFQIAQAAIEAFTQLKTDNPIRYSSEEKKIVEASSLKVEKEDSEVVMSTLSKALFLSVHASNEDEKKAAFATAQKLLSAIGSRIEYQEEFDALRKQPLYKEFCANIPVEYWKPIFSIKGSSSKTIAQQELDALFLKSPQWLLVVLRDTTPPLHMGSEEKQAIEAYTESLHAQQFLSSFFLSPPERKDLSLNEMAQLLKAFEKLDPKNPSTQDIKNKLDAYLGNITEDKQKRADRILEGKSVSKVMGKEKDDKQRRIQETVAPLLYQACYGPITDTKAVAALPQLLQSIIRENPVELRDLPAPFLQKYLEKYGKSLEVEAKKIFLSYLIEKNPNILIESEDIFALSMTCIPGDLKAQAAFKELKAFRDNPPPYTTDEGWKQRADTILLAAEAIRVALKNMGITADLLLEDTSKRLEEQIHLYEQTVEQDPECKKILDDMSSLDKTFKEHMAAQNHDACVQDLQTYRSLQKKLETFTAKKFPIDAKFVFDTKNHPHARMISETSKKWREEKLKELSDTAEIAEAAIQDSPQAQQALQNGRESIKTIIEKLQTKTPEELRRSSFSDEIKQELEAAIGGDVSPEMMNWVKDTLFSEMMETERKEIKLLAGDLEQEAFSPENLEKYEKHVTQLYLLSHIRYSGESYQPLTDVQKSEVFKNWHHPLYGEKMKKVRGAAGTKANLVDAFERRIQSLQQNLDDFQIRLKRKPPEVALADTRSSFEGVVTNMVSKGALLSSAAATLPAEVKTKVDRAATILSAFGSKTLKSLSPKTQGASADRLAQMFAQDPALTPGRIQELISQTSVQLKEALTLLQEAISSLGKDHPAVKELRNLYVQVCTWTKIPVQDMLTTAQDPKLREALKNLLTYLRDVSIDT